MHSDTIIGLVGAVLLVGVMVGVFAYEYNNADVDDAEENPDAAALHDFQDAYPNLNATQDIDGDGIANYLDDDLDGDGIDNHNDTDVKFHDAFAGSVSQGLGTPVSQPAGYAADFVANSGIMHVVLTVSHGERAAGDQNLAPLDVTFTLPSGETRTAAATTSGGTTTYTIDLSGDATPGTYSLTVEPFAGPGGLGGDPGTSFSGEVVFHYDPGMAAEPHDH